ncbi:hypothetical protein D9758_008532 [Tetrapyrgos nigripes]|uniref:Major facilitator superfamily (MFS) profile domain-containing protein n=1 Tax=Tetrapyrgos nigripes TaxID=182062 RepID=A0A8H5G5K7_9AGAR|nr:hypothetical protein D9758_008532 [Tetrapyrgos nigripes]
MSELVPEVECVRNDSEIDEETPLLQGPPQLRRTPLPWAQFWIVLFLQLAEPLTSQVVAPFAPQLVRDMGVTHGDETRVGTYVGLLIAVFWFSQSVTVLHWSRLSDHIGRKPVILSGLAGLSFSMYCFGLSTTFRGFVISRAMTGILNGNIGVLKSMIAELTDSTNIAQAYAYTPAAWTSGGLLGPLAGGLLAHPAEQYPNVFGNSEFLKKHPYFLPSAVPATFAVCGWVIAFFFLKEPLKAPQPISSLFRFRRNQNCELQPEDAVVTDETENPVPFSRLLTWRVLLVVANYGFLSLIDIMFRGIHPLFLSTPVALGGLALPPSVIGKLVAAFGVCNGLVEILFFAWMHDTRGPKFTFLFGVISGVPTFALFPAISMAAKAYGLVSLTWTLVGLQIVFSSLMSFSFGAIFIYIANSAPNRASLGMTNGLNQMTVGLTRAIGPAVSNSLFSVSIKHNYVGGYMVYTVLVAAACVAMVVGSMLPGRGRH